MATAAPVPKYSPSDLVKYKDKGQYIVLSVQTNLGFNKYHIMNIEDGHSEQASSHELTKINTNIPKKEEDIETPEENIEELNENVVKPRFKTLKPEELDDLARKRTEKTTDKQTTWAIRIFKGK